ncbi:hypothetical protein [Bacillus sp. UNC41MFS5]|uniref:hypothetical protein n=1 Tax=Bacillus sp. UNC41MFS5 TaxID=1449046 RepID=UPI003FA4A3C3
MKQRFMEMKKEGVGKAIAESIVPHEELFITTKLWNADHSYETMLVAFDEVW